MGPVTVLVVSSLSSLKAKLLVTAGAFAGIGAASGVVWQVSVDGLLDGIPDLTGVGFVVMASVVALRMVVTAAKYQSSTTTETVEGQRQQIVDLQEDLRVERERLRTITVDQLDRIADAARETAEWRAKYEQERSLRISLEARGISDRRNTGEHPAV